VLKGLEAKQPKVVQTSVSCLKEVVAYVLSIRRSYSEAYS
jgi:hypothetical protein